MKGHPAGYSEFRFGASVKYSKATEVLLRFPRGSFFVFRPKVGVWKSRLTNREHAFHAVFFFFLIEPSISAGVTPPQY